MADSTPIYFVIDKNCVEKMKKPQLVRINQLFNVKVFFNEVRDNQQWVKMEGHPGSLSKAKEYFVAMTKPETQVVMKSVWDHKQFTKEKHAYIEMVSAAVVTKHGDNGVNIAGSQMAVILAVSLIEEILGSGSAELPMVVDEEDGSVDKDITSTDNVPESQATKENNTAGTSKKGKVKKKKKSPAQKSKTDESVDTVSESVEPNAGDSPHSLEQRAFLRSMACSRGLALEDIDKAVPLFDMNDIVRPAEFINAVEDIAAQRNASADEVFSTDPKGTRKRLSWEKTNSPVAQPPSDVRKSAQGQRGGRKEKAMNLDASVICLDSSEDEEETMVMRPYESGVPCGIKAVRDRSLIILSSDEEEGDKVDHLIARNSNSATTNHQISVDDDDDNLDHLLESANRQGKQAALDRLAGRQPDFIPLGGPARKNNNSVITNPPSNNRLTGIVHPHLSQSQPTQQPTATSCRIEPASSKSSKSNPSDLNPPPVVSVASSLELSAQSLDRLAGRDGLISEGAASSLSREGGLRQDYIDSLMREDAQPKKQRTGLRYIIIDGSNVAMSHGNQHHYSVPGIELCIKYFLRRGHRNITAFVPQWRQYAANLPLKGRELLTLLENAGFLKFTPARRIPIVQNGQTRQTCISSYDDRYILNLAVAEDGVIVSNDLFKDLQNEKPGYKEVTVKNLLQYTFVQDHFMPADDPLGRHGPTLDDFLCHPDPPRLRSVVARDLPHLALGSCGGVPGRGNLPHQAGGGASRGLPETTTGPVGGRWLPLRDDQTTHRLFAELCKIFPEPDQKAIVRQVLQNHTREVDLNRLTNYCINAMGSGDL